MTSATKERGFKTGGVSRCFQCGLQLQRFKGGFSFKEVLQQDGHRVRVHAHCLKLAIADGYKGATQ